MHEIFKELHDLSSFKPVAEWYGVQSLEYRLLKRGIGFHHGQLPDSVRRAIEDDFRSNKIKILFANSTVSQGVNFPIKYLIIHSLVLKAKKNELAERISQMDFWNLAGRAGRAGKETEGQIIFLVNSASERQTYTSYIKQDNVDPVESVFSLLVRYLVENRISQDAFVDYAKQFSEPSILAMIAEEAIGSPDEEIINSLIENSLFKVQLLSNPSFISGIESLKVVFKSIPERFRTQVPDEKLRTAFANTGFSLDSNLALHKFVLESGEVKSAILTQDVLSLIHHCIKFFISSKLKEITFVGIEHFAELSDEAKNKILDAWVNGKPISEILFDSGNSVPRISPDKFQRLLSQGFTYRYPWAIAGIFQILAVTMGDGFEAVSETLLMTSTYLKYGVNNKVAALFLGLGVSSRQLAIKLAQAVQTEDFKASIDWIRSISPEELFSLGFIGSEVTEIINMAHNLSRTSEEKQEWSFQVKGTTYSEYRKKASNEVVVGDELRLQRDPENEFDPFAIKVYWDQQELGYVPRTSARVIAPLLDLLEGTLVTKVIAVNSVYDWSKVDVKTTTIRI